MGFWSSLYQRILGAHGSLEGNPAGGAARPAWQSSSGAPVVVLDRPPPDSDRIDDNSPWWQPFGDTVREYQPTTRPDLATEARAIESVLISHFDGHDLNLPPLLNVAERVLIRLRDSKCSMGDVGRAVSEDQVIAAAVMRMANSPLYRGLTRVTSVPNAVSRLGISALRTLMMRESMRSAMFGKQRDALGFAERVWRQSLASATVMQELSRFTNLAPDDAALYGLLHDIGNVVVLRIVLDQVKSTGVRLEFEEFEYLCSECHQEFGELIAAAWKLPPDLASLVGNHHTHPESDDPLRVERLMLATTDMICSLLGHTTFAPYALLEARPVVELRLGDKSGFVKMLEELPQTVDEAIGA